MTAASLHTPHRLICALQCPLGDSEGHRPCWTVMCLSKHTFSPLGLRAFFMEQSVWLFDWFCTRVPTQDLVLGRQVLMHLNWIPGNSWKCLTMWGTGSNISLNKLVDSSLGRAGQKIKDFSQLISVFFHYSFSPLASASNSKVHKTAGSVCP